jgi:hypothetical protein
MHKHVVDGLDLHRSNYFVSSLLYMYTPHRRIFALWRQVCYHVASVNEGQRLILQGGDNCCVVFSPVFSCHGCFMVTKSSGSVCLGQRRLCRLQGPLCRVEPIVHGHAVVCFGFAGTQPSSKHSSCHATLGMPRRFSNVMCQEFATHLRRGDL